MNILHVFSDLIWPRTCEICRRPVDRPGRHFCSECLNRIPFVRPEDGDDVLPDVVSAVRFEEEAREAVNAYKFRRAVWLRDDFTDWLEAAAAARFDLAAVDIVLAVPMTVFGRRDRGYNQCDYLAAALAKRIDRTFRRRVLVRRGSPARQSTLTEDERRRNVVGTFAVAKPEWVRGRTVLLVNDILTTGATLGEAVKTLKAAGAARVWSATLARSVRH